MTLGLHPIFLNHVEVEMLHVSSIVIVVVLIESTQIPWMELLIFPRRFVRGSWMTLPSSWVLTMWTAVLHSIEFLLEC